MAEVVVQARPNLVLAPAGDDLVGAEIELVTMEGRERRLRALIEPLVRFNVLPVDPMMRLRNQLEKALKQENYELAAKIRDEIRGREMPPPAQLAD